MAEDFITSAEGNFFQQTERANPFGWLTCTGVGDIDIPLGDRTPQYCQDPLSSGKFKIVDYIRGEPGAGTYSLTKPLSKVANWLLELECDFVGRINWVCRGVRQDPRNYEVAVLMLDSGAIRKGIPAPVAMAGADEARVNTNMDVNFSLPMVLYHLAWAQQEVTNTADAWAVYFMPQRCEDRCGPARGLCEVGIIGLDGPGAYIYEAEIKKTLNGGADWDAAPTDPYTWGGRTEAVYILETVSGRRFIVWRGEPVIPQPAECSYSDDDGVTWTNVTIGAIAQQAVNDVTVAGAMFLIACTDGYIYSSEDQAETWSIQEGGVETAESVRAITTYGNAGYAVCNGNIFLFTSNVQAASPDWASRTGPAVGFDLLSIDVNDKGHIFVGTSDARLFRSEDEGLTWALVIDFGAGTIDDVMFEEKGNYVGALIWNNATPVGAVYRSEDGGATWPQIANMPTNVGLNALHMCDQNTISVVGNAVGGSTFIARTTH